MATVDPARALPLYQTRVGVLHNEILMRDVAIADLEEQVQRLQDENAQLRSRSADEPSGYADGPHPGP